jgi:hypothetical protein
MRDPLTTTASMPFLVRQGAAPERNDAVKTTSDITYRYEIDGNAIEISRRHTGTAYARNGNVHNPTEYFTWEARVNGVEIGRRFSSRADAYENARAKALGIRYVNDDRRHKYVNVRPFQMVAAEMRAAYRGRA